MDCDDVLMSDDAVVTVGRRTTCDNGQQCLMSYDAVAVRPVITHNGAVWVA